MLILSISTLLISLIFSIVILIFVLKLNKLYNGVNS